MPEEGMQPGAGGNIFTNRIMGVPGIVWLIGAGVLAYFIFFRNKGQSAGSPSTSGGGGTITTGNTQIQKGAVTVNVSQPQTSTETSTSTTDVDNPGGPDNDQPGPPVPPRTHKGKAVKIPNEKGQRAAFAISDLESIGLEVKTNPFRDPKKEYEVTGTTPPAGAMVPEGSMVSIQVKALPKSNKGPAAKGGSVPTPFKK